MLRVTVEIVPFGYESKKRTLYEMEIINIGNMGVTHTGDGDRRYSYKVRTRPAGQEEKTDHGLVVKEWDRNRPLTDLLKEILNKFDEKGEL